MTTKYQSYKQLVDLEWAKAGTIWDVVGIGMFAFAQGYIEGVVSQPCICVSTLKKHPEWFQLLEEGKKYAASKSSSKRKGSITSKGSSPSSIDKRTRSSIR